MLPPRGGLRPPWESSRVGKGLQMRQIFQSGLAVRTIPARVGLVLALVSVLIVSCSKKEEETPQPVETLRVTLLDPRNEMRLEVSGIRRSIRAATRHRGSNAPPRP